MLCCLVLTNKKHWKLVNEVMERIQASPGPLLSAIRDLILFRAKSCDAALDTTGIRDQLVKMVPAEWNNKKDKTIVDEITKKFENISYGFGMDVPLQPYIFMSTEISGEDGFTPFSQSRAIPDFHDDTIENAIKFSEVEEFIEGYIEENVLVEDDDDEELTCLFDSRKFNSWGQVLQHYSEDHVKDLQDMLLIISCNSEPFYLKYFFARNMYPHIFSIRRRNVRFESTAAAPELIRQQKDVPIDKDKLMKLCMPLMVWESEHMRYKIWRNIPEDVIAELAHNLFTFREAGNSTDLEDIFYIRNYTYPKNERDPERREREQKAMSLLFDTQKERPTSSKKKKVKKLRAPAPKPEAETLTVSKEDAKEICNRIVREVAEGSVQDILQQEISNAMRPKTAQEKKTADKKARRKQRKELADKVYASLLESVVGAEVERIFSKTLSDIREKEEAAKAEAEAEARAKAISEQKAVEKSKEEAFKEAEDTVQEDDEGWQIVQRKKTQPHPQAPVSAPAIAKPEPVVEVPEMAAARSPMEFQTDFSPKFQHLQDILNLGSPLSIAAENSNADEPEKQLELAPLDIPTETKEPNTPINLHNRFMEIHDIIDKATEQEEEKSPAEVETKDESVHLPDPDATLKIDQIGGELFDSFKFGQLKTALETKPLFSSDARRTPEDFGFTPVLTVKIDDIPMSISRIDDVVDFLSEQIDRERIKKQSVAFLKSSNMRSCFVELKSLRDVKSACKLNGTVFKGTNITVSAVLTVQSSFGRGKKDEAVERSTNLLSKNDNISEFAEFAEEPRAEAPATEKAETRPKSEYMAPFMTVNAPPMDDVMKEIISNGMEDELFSMGSGELLMPLEEEMGRSNPWERKEEPKGRLTFFESLGDLDDMEGEVEAGGEGTDDNVWSSVNMFSKGYLWGPEDE